VLVGNLIVAFDMVDHLYEVVGEAVKVDLPGDWTPPEVKVTLSLVGQFYPSFGASFHEDTADEIAVVALHNLELVDSGPRQRVFLK